MQAREALTEHKRSGEMPVEVMGVGQSPIGVQVHNFPNFIPPSLFLYTCTVKCSNPPRDVILGSGGRISFPGSRFEASDFQHLRTDVAFCAVPPTPDDVRQ